MTIALVIATILNILFILYIIHDEKLIDGYKDMLAMILHEVEEMRVELAEEWEKEKNENGGKRELEEEV